jgi:ornithine cyclodeaminase
MIPKGIAALTASDVERLLPMADCIEAMAGAFRAIADGTAVQPLRQVTHVPNGAGSLYSMPAYLPSPDGGTLSVKLITLFHGNARVGLESHQGLIVLFSGEHGEPLALIEAASVTAIRTAAVSALATRYLSLPDSSVLAILGSGVQARSHLEAMRAVRPISHVRVWSRSPERARAFVRQTHDRFSVNIEAVSSAEAAVRGADIICTVSAAREPVLHSDWVSAGAHINAIGSSTPDAREIDSETVARAWVFVDSREAALTEAGDLLIPIEEGVIGPEHIKADLAELVAGRSPGREGGAEVTLFKSLGLAVEDAAAARRIYDQAIADPRTQMLRMTDHPADIV